MGFYHAPLKWVAKLLLTLEATLLVFTACLLLLGFTDGTCIGPGRILFDFIWAWTMSHLRNYWLIPVAGGHKKGKEFIQASTRWIWTLGLCPWNCFLTEPACIYGELESWGRCGGPPVLHLYSYHLYLECLLSRSVNLWQRTSVLVYTLLSIQFLWSMLLHPQCFKDTKALCDSEYSASPYRDC